MKAVMGNLSAGAEVFEGILGIHQNTTITAKEVKIAGANWIKGNELMRQLVSKVDVQFTEEAAEIIVRRFGEDVVSLLLKKHPPTRSMISVAAMNKRHGGNVMRALVEASEGFELDANTFSVALGNKLSGREVIGVFLNRKKVKIMEEVVVMALRLDFDIAQLLLRREDIEVTENVLYEAATSTRGNAGMKLLFSLRPDASITE